MKLFISVVCLALQLGSLHSSFAGGGDISKFDGTTISAPPKRAPIVRSVTNSFDHPFEESEYGHPTVEAFRQTLCAGGEGSPLLCGKNHGRRMRFAMNVLYGADENNLTSIGAVGFSLYPNGDVYFDRLGTIHKGSAMIRNSAGPFTQMDPRDLGAMWNRFVDFEAFFSSATIDALVETAFKNGVPESSCLWCDPHKVYYPELVDKVRKLTNFCRTSEHLSACSDGGYPSPVTVPKAEKTISGRVYALDFLDLGRIGLSSRTATEDLHAGLELPAARGPATWGSKSKISQSEYLFGISDGKNISRLGVMRIQLTALNYSDPGFLEDVWKLAVERRQTLNPVSLNSSDGRWIFRYPEAYYSDSSGSAQELLTLLTR
jgi:hypothetical protein